MIHKRFILALDDDPDFNAFLETTIRDFQYEIKCCEDPSEFFQILNAKTPDICLVDLNMGGHINAGLRYIRIIRALIKKDIPIVVVSGNDDDRTVKTAKADGAIDYIFKPLNPTILRYVLKKNLEKRERAFGVPDFYHLFNKLKKSAT